MKKNYEIMISIIFLSYSLISCPNYNPIIAAELGDGHNMPSASLGERNTVLTFNTIPSQPKASNSVGLDFTLLDNKTGKNIQHVTYLVSIQKDGKRLFTETVHAHDGHIKIEFIQSKNDPYHINANFDVLSASYVSDFGSPIKVNGMVFSDPGNYTLTLEVTGVDFDNTFLPKPLKFDFNLYVT